MRAPDQDRRDAIVTARGIDVSVEAGAGTGKTTLLVTRVLSRLEGGTPLPRLAIITFTRKAAAELVARIRVELGKHRETHAWAAAALDDFDRASIGTTDSFCRTILSDFPLEAGVPPGFGLADEVAQSALRGAAWGRLLERTGDDGRRLLARLRELGLSTTKVRTVADDLLSNRDLSVASFDSSPPPDLLPIFEERLAAALAFRDRCTDETDGLFLHLAELERDLDIARAVGGVAGERALLQRSREKKKYAPSGRGRNGGKQASWGGAENKDAVLTALGRLEDAVDVHLEARGRYLAARVALWVRGYFEAYDAAKRERGLVDFRDLALATRDLLRRNRRVRRLVASRFDEILMDEVQDTDPLQMEIAFLLAADGDPPAGAGNDPLSADRIPGRLFLVGDPKQSIYRFRRADIELYERARQLLAKTGRAESIIANFRSHPEIVDFVNRVFEKWMDRPAGETWQARWEPLVAGKEAPAGGAQAPRVSLLLPDEKLAATLLERSGRTKLGAGAREELELDAVSRHVASVLGGGVDASAALRVPDGEGGERAAIPSDVAVLVRKIAWGDRLLESLRRRGVPAAVVGGKRFHAKEEIRTLLAVLEPLIEPDDALARFTALRSPAFGIPDDDLVLHFLEAEEPDDPGAAAVADALARLDRLRAEARSRPVPELLERVVEELTLVPVFGFRPDGAGRVESLRILLEAADSLVESGFDSLPAFVHWLREEAREERGEAPGEGDPGAGGGVQILTMHKSKGLEFPIVILADLGSGTPTDRRFVPDRATGSIDFRLSAPDRIRTPGFEAAAAAEQLRQTAEEVRLLYVAMTRAREHLVLSWPPVTRGFLASPKGAPSLAGGVGCAPGDPPATDSGLGMIRAVDLPTAERETRFQAVDPDRLPTAVATPADTWPECSARARRGRRLRAATSWAAGEPHATSRPASGGPGTAPLHGAAFGSLVHKFLEIHDPAGRRARPEEIRRAEALLSGEIDRPLDAATLAATARWLDRVLADPRVAEVLDAAGAPTGSPRTLREVPFLLPVGDGVVSGTFDALMDLPDGTLRIVDWKTDRIGAEPGDSARLRYRSQAAIYAWAASHLTGRTVRDVRFLFLDADPVAEGSFRVDEGFIREAEALVGNGGRDDRHPGQDSPDEPGAP